MSLAHHARVVRATLRRNWLLSVTYPSWLVNRIVGPFVWVVLGVYSYLAVASPGDIAAGFERLHESGDFVGFLVLGQTVFSFFTNMNWRGGMAIQRERWTGTLEIVLLAPASRVTWVLAESLFGLLDSGWTVFLAMAAAALLFGVGFHVAAPLAALVALTLTLVAMVSLGLFFAGFYVLTRAAGPLSYGIGAPIRFFSGVQFPVAALPAALQAVSYAIPVTYGLFVVRRTLLGGATFGELARPFAALVVASAIFATLGILFLRRFEAVAKERGTLHTY